MGDGEITFGRPLVIYEIEEEPDNSSGVSGEGVGISLEASNDDSSAGCDSTGANDVRGLGVSACPRVIIGRGTVVSSETNDTCCLVADASAPPLLEETSGLVFSSENSESSSSIFTCCLFRLFFSIRSLRFQPVKVVVLLISSCSCDTNKGSHTIAIIKDQKNTIV